MTQPISLKAVSNEVNADEIKPLTLATFFENHKDHIKVIKKAVGTKFDTDGMVARAGGEETLAASPIKGLDKLLHCMMVVSQGSCHDWAHSCVLKGGSALKNVSKNVVAYQPYIDNTAMDLDVKVFL